MDVATVQKSGQVVFTNKARCRDCYRCLRACPVKAIRVVDGQAFVEADRCIACGTCIRECPQGAKGFRNDVDRASRLIEANPGRVAASLAPSFVSHFGEAERCRLAGALQRLGFAYVGETAVGAYHVAQVTAEHVAGHPDCSHICTACPVAVNYIEQYEPDLVPLLVPVVSPMIAHARHIKKRLGPKTKVVFIGPCVAKKSEADRAEHEACVDVVLTYSELLEWFERENIYLLGCEERRFDEEPGGDSRFFPVPGGLARTAALDTDLLATTCLAVSGPDEMREAFDRARGSSEPIFIEPLFCPHGCINGPGMPRENNLFERRGDLIDYAASHEGRAKVPEAARADLEAHFAPGALTAPEFTEEQILDVLERTGKGHPDDQLNCGACGYPSCRHQALAVLAGMATVEMCIPYMRRLAEQRSDKIMETTPNGIVILDEHLTILYMNPAFKKMFLCTKAVEGKPISYLMDPEPFERVALHGLDMLELRVHHKKYSLISHQIIYPLKQERQYVGVLVNITKGITSQDKLEQLRNETLREAQQMMAHQIEVAQQMAQFLGESTARSEKLVRNLFQMASDKPNDGGGFSLWDTDTSI